MARTYSRTFSGARLRRLRQERGLTQVALAKALDLSTSYVNQLENDQRPITVPVLLLLTERFDLSAQYFSSDSDARLVADLSDVFTDIGVEHAVSGAQIEEFVARMPEVGHSLVAVHRRLRAATEELEGYRSRATAETELPPARPMPFEEVRDFFYDRNNYIHDLDMAAERMFTESGMRTGGLDIQLAELMRDRFGISVVIDDNLPDTAKRRYHPDTKVLRVAHWLMPGQRAFQIATQLALVGQSDLISSIVATDDQLSTEARGVARIGLANYFAGAFLLPYREFHRAAEQLRYDIDLLGRRFGVGFETVCHRLSTLQRPRQRGYRSSSSAPTRPETSQSDSPRRRFTSAGSAAAARCGWSTTRSPSQRGSSARWRKCPTAGRTSGWPRPPLPTGSGIWARTRTSRSGWAATSRTPINSSTPPVSSWTTRARRSRSGRAARSATERRAPNVRSPISVVASRSTRTRAAACLIRRPSNRFDRPTPQQTTKPLILLWFQQALGKHCCRCLHIAFSHVFHSGGDHGGLRVIGYRAVPRAGADL